MLLMPLISCVQMKEAQSKLKAECEVSVKMRKTNAELSVAVKRQESVVADQAEKLAALQVSGEFSVKLTPIAFWV